MKASMRLISIFVVILGITAILAACSQGFSGAGGAQPAQAASTTSATGPTSKSNVAYHPKSLKPEISGSSVSVPLGEVEQAGNANFFVGTPAGTMSFMVYVLDGKDYVRADICPPCGSRSFTLQGGRLICDSCGTVFDGATGAGVRGACVAYPKASVPYVTGNGNITMTANDLATAYQNTLNRKG